MFGTCHCNFSGLVCYVILVHGSSFVSCLQRLRIRKMPLFMLPRVNLIGGGQAKGSPRDAAVVFTPAKAADNQLYMYNLTLPHGFFSRAPIGATDLFKRKYFCVRCTICWNNCCFSAALV